MSSCNELSMSWQRLMFRNFRQRPATSEEQLLKFFNFLANSISISMASDRVINNYMDQFTCFEAPHRAGPMCRHGSPENPLEAPQDGNIMKPHATDCTTLHQHNKDNQKWLSNQDKQKYDAQIRRFYIHLLSLFKCFLIFMSQGAASKTEKVLTRANKEQLYWCVPDLNFKFRYGLGG